MLFKWLHRLLNKIIAFSNNLVLALQFTQLIKQIEEINCGIAVSPASYQHPMLISG